MKTRIYFLDNLRSFLILLVVILHSGLVYEVVLESNWIVVDSDKNSSIGLIRMYIDLIVMFAMFFISGYFIPRSLEGKTNWTFIKSKIKRIFLPWLIAVLTIIPIYKAIFLFSRGMPQQEWFSYFHLFQREGSDLSFFANNPIQGWLWFLPVLFLFQIIYLVLARTNILKIRISLNLAIGLTFILSVAYGVLISAEGLMGWTHNAILHFQNERLLIYFLVFLLGSLSYKLGVFNSKKANKQLFIISNVVLTISLLAYTAVALNLFFNMITPGRNYYFISESIDGIAYHITFVISMLSFLYVLIHLFRFKFNGINPIMKQLNSASYNVYIIHMIVIGVLALILINLSIAALFKFIILSIFTFIISHLIVYGYQQSKQKIFTMKTALIFLFIASLLSAAYFGNAKEQDKTQPSISLHMATMQGNLEVVKQHIESGSDLNIVEPYGGGTPLIVATTFGKTEIALALIKAGADLNKVNNDGSSPVHIAAFFCRLEILKSLLANNADKSLVNNSGSTALQSVEVPYSMVKGIYEYLAGALGSLGLTLDYEYLEETRPIIAEMLKFE